jgi:hypothetical protein
MAGFTSLGTRFRQLKKDLVRAGVLERYWMAEFME